MGLATPSVCLLQTMYQNFHCPVNTHTTEREKKNTQFPLWGNEEDQKMRKAGERGLRSVRNTYAVSVSPKPEKRVRKARQRE